MSAPDDKKQDSPSLAAFKKRCERLDEIDIDEVLRALDADPNQDHDKTKWKLPNGNNLWHKRNTQHWKDLNEDRGGTGGVRLVAHALGLKPGAAAKWLEERFLDAEGNIRASAIVSSEALAKGEAAAGEFRAPRRDDRDLPAVIEYLTGQRGIPPSLIASEVARGYLYATSRARDMDLPKEEWVYVPHCVFASRAASELRSVEPDGFKGTAPGSESNSSGYKVPYAASVKEPLLCMVEAGVDALSYRALFPGRFTTSTNGAGRFEFQFGMVLEALDIEGFGVRLAFDADAAGDVAAQKIFNALYASKAIASRAGVPAGVVEDWFLDRTLSTSPGHSPHELFYGSDLGLPETLPVYKCRKEKVNGKMKEIWEPDGSVSRPLIAISVSRRVPELEKLGFGPGSTLSMHPTPQGTRYVEETLGVRRDRPVRTKDWNEELLRLGSAFVVDYERCAKDDFAAGAVPALPQELEALRRVPARLATALPDTPATPVPPGPPPPARSSAATPPVQAPATMEHPAAAQQTPPAPAMEAAPAVHPAARQPVPVQPVVRRFGQPRTPPPSPAQAAEAGSPPGIQVRKFSRPRP